MKELIVSLRKETGMGLLDCQRALKDANGDFEKAKISLIQNSKKRTELVNLRVVNEGIVTSYIHSNKKLGSLVSIRCETDFVAKNELFVKFANDIAMQVAVIEPLDINDLLSSKFIKDENITIDSYKNQMMTKLGENIKIDSFQYIKL